MLFLLISSTIKSSFSSSQHILIASWHVTHTQTTTIAVIATLYRFHISKVESCSSENVVGQNNGKNIPFFVTFSRIDCLLAASSRVAISSPVVLITTVCMISFRLGYCCCPWSFTVALRSRPIRGLSASSISQSHSAARVFLALSDVTSLLR